MIGTLPHSDRAFAPPTAGAPTHQIATDRATSVALGLTTALLGVVALCGVVMLIAPTVLRDPPGYAGNALGTYLVMLLVAVPVTAVAMRRSWLNSSRARRACDSIML